MKLHPPPGCIAASVLLFAAAAFADTSFQVKRTSRDEVPAGKGQCDILLRVDHEVEVSVRGDMVSIHSVAGQGARDDGSECSAPLPNRDVEGFAFHAVASRNLTSLVAHPSSANGFTAVVRIRRGDSGEGRYHFRLTWILPTGDSDHIRDSFERPSAVPGSSWNNAANFRGNGSGTASMNGAGETGLREVSIEIDRGGKLAAAFRTGDRRRGRTMNFTGQMLAVESGRWKADVMSEDRRLRGPMWISVDEKQRVTSVTLEATDGQDQLHLTWHRR